MTKEEMIYVLQNAKYDGNGDCLNVECRSRVSGKWGKNALPTWDFYNYDYRIIEPKRIEITKDLRGKWFRRKDDKVKWEYSIGAISVTEKIIKLDGIFYTEDALNREWELVD